MLLICHSKKAMPKVTITTIKSYFGDPCMDPKIAFMKHVKVFLYQEGNQLPLFGFYIT
jgi:hypothetical protein